MGQCGLHKQPSMACLSLTIAWGIAANWHGASVLMLGVGVGAVVGRIDQSFLASNRFSGADPSWVKESPVSLGHWVCPQVVEG